MKNSQRVPTKTTLLSQWMGRLVIVQHSIDVVVVLFGPDGKQIAEYDDEDWNQGQEMASQVAEASGIYRLEVKPKLKGATAPTSVLPGLFHSIGRVGQPRREALITIHDIPCKGDIQWQLIGGESEKSSTGPSR